MIQIVWSLTLIWAQSGWCSTTSQPESMPVEIDCTLNVIHVDADIELHESPLFNLASEQSP